MAKSSSTHATAQKGASSVRKPAAPKQTAVAKPSTGFAMSLPPGNPALTQERMGQMQRYGGNQAVAQGLANGTIHTSFPVGGVDTALERDAERQASGLVASMPSRVTATDAGDDRVLSQPAREFFEARMGATLDGVRLHTGRQAAESARALDANAFTVGRDVVFGEGKFDSGSAEGRRILAHELVHVGQQNGRSPLIQRDVDKKKKKPKSYLGPQSRAEGFGATYKSTTTNANVPYDDYMEMIGQDPKVPDLQAASESGGTQIDPVAIALADLKAILNPNSTPRANMDKEVDAHKEDVETILGLLKLVNVDMTIADVKRILISPPRTPEQELDVKLEEYLEPINIAFETMKLDTAEAQAVYLAHAAGETGGLKKLEETTIQNKGYKGFEGRGPIQVTTKGNYVQTLAYMEKAAKEKLESKDEKEKKAGEQAMEAVQQIKKNPENAADPKYTFLFSAAFMQMIGGARRSAEIGADPQFPGNKPEDTWVSGHDHQANHDAAVARLAKATAKAAGADAGTPAGKKLIDAKAKAEKDVQEWSSTLSRSKIKKETYNTALGILKKKDVKLKKAAPAPATAPPKAAACGLFANFENGWLRR